MAIRSGPFTLRFALSKTKIRRTMHKCCLFLLGVVIYFATCSEAASTFKTTQTTSLIPQGNHKLHVNSAKDAPAKRFLRKTSKTDEDNEDRAFMIPSLAKRLGNKIKRLAKYNWWIFTNKKPQEVTDPRYQGYWNFYHDRMTPGGKYH